MINIWTGIQRTESKSGLSRLEPTIHCSCTTCKHSTSIIVSTMHRNSALVYNLLSWCVACRCIRPTPEELEHFGTPDFTIYNAGMFPCNRYTHYMTSSTSVDLNLARKEMVILGTQYAGEMKKGLFCVMHYLMPKRHILSLHSGCNLGKEGDVALFFGLSGTLSYYICLCSLAICDTIILGSF